MDSDETAEARFIQLATFVPPDLAEQVKAAARKDDRSISAWIRKAMLRELQQQAA